VKKILILFLIFMAITQTYSNEKTPIKLAFKDKTMDLDLNLNQFLTLKNILSDADFEQEDPISLINFSSTTFSLLLKLTNAISEKQRSAILDKQKNIRNIIELFNLADFLDTDKSTLLSITQALLKAIQTSYSKILKTSKDYVEQINKQLKEDGLGFADGYQGLLNLISWNKAGITFLGEGKNVQINDNTIAFISRAGDQETIESYHLSTKDSHEHNLKEGQELVHFSPDLKYAIVTHDYVSEIKNLENNKPVVKIRNKIKQSYFSPDLKHLVLNLYDHNKDIYSVMIIDLNNNSSHVIPGEMSLKKPIFNSNSKYLIGVNDKDDSLILLNLDNKTQIKTILLKDFTSDDLPLYSFSKDGTHLIVSNNKSKEVLLYNMDDIAVLSPS
jgi:WD40 repeat protein